MGSMAMKLMVKSILAGWLMASWVGSSVRSCVK